MIIDIEASRKDGETDREMIARLIEEKCGLIAQNEAMKQAIDQIEAALSHMQDQSSWIR